MEVRDYCVTRDIYHVTQQSGTSPVTWLSGPSAERGQACQGHTGNPSEEPLVLFGLLNLHSNKTQEEDSQASFGVTALVISLQFLTVSYSYLIIKLEEKEGRRKMKNGATQPEQLHLSMGRGVAVP